MSRGALRTITLSALFLVISTSAADAYIGPGSGLSAIGSILGVFAAVFLALVGFVWYPIKQIYRRVKANAKVSAENEPVARRHEPE